MTSLSPHSHANGTCPMTGQSHEWCPAQAGDSRAPCPALNTLANHGYLPRDGRRISAATIIHAVQEGYGISKPLAFVLGYGGQLVLGQAGEFSLGDLARHNRIEHNASLVHDDAQGRHEYAPSAPDDVMLKALLDDSRDGRYMTARDVARARVRREATYGSAVLDSFHAEIARGEMAIVLGLFDARNPGKGEDGVPLAMLKGWLHDERLPEGWKPGRTTGLWETIERSAEIRKAMDEMRRNDSTTDR
ncbi:Chloroperoxidase 3 [Heterobasidion irregulare TC 32-1]|uniref:Chloroperoxidase 3 n=1 Tax=Heterobasidion irregulare (strain TC 32-1) TaxID=747525 RepID=W4JZ79_HETIT|nr:Chloroperoxidase 3 [Heterobasidion irregulare TC 32-1]ETW78181.1 Chloroperoxidase 3 [Heterobasidion irregulare TC 32-1]